MGRLVGAPPRRQSCRRVLLNTNGAPPRVLLNTNGAPPRVLLDAIFCLVNILDISSSNALGEQISDEAHGPKELRRQMLS